MNEWISSNKNERDLMVEVLIEREKGERFWWSKRKLEGEEWMWAIWRWECWKRKNNKNGCGVWERGRERQVGSKWEKINRFSIVPNEWKVRD
jgi:hypothetical protein